MPLFFHAEGVSFRLRKRRMHRAWLSLCIEKKGFLLGDINIVFCSDDYLLEMNRTHLEHDYYTDIITFDYREGTMVSGDLYISIDRVKDNARAEKTLLEQELRRVMIHGLLHIMGQGDKSPEEAREMRAMEDSFLTLYPQTT